MGRYRCPLCGNPVAFDSVAAAQKTPTAWCTACRHTVRPVEEKAEEADAFPVAGKARVEPPDEGPGLFSPELTEYGRRFGLVWGLLLLVGGLLPDIALSYDGTPKAVFVPLSMLAKPWVPLSAKLALAFPFWAGALMLVTSRLLRGALLGWVLFAMTAFISVPFVMILGAGILFGDLGYVSMGWPAALCGLFVALRIHRSGGRSILACVVGVVSAVALAGMFITPIVVENSRTTLTAVIMGLVKKQPAVGVMILLLTAALAVAAGICVACVRYREESTVRLARLARIGLWVLLVDLMAGAVLLSFVRWWPARGRLGLGYGILPLAEGVKTLLWPGGFAAAVAVAVLQLYQAYARWEGRGVRRRSAVRTSWLARPEPLSRGAKTTAIMACALGFLSVVLASFPLARVYWGTARQWQTSERRGQSIAAVIDIPSALCGEITPAGNRPSQKAEPLTLTYRPWYAAMLFVPALLVLVSLGSLFRVLPEIVLRVGLLTVGPLCMVALLLMETMSFVTHGGGPAYCSLALTGFLVLLCHAGLVGCGLVLAGMAAPRRAV